MSDPTKAEMLVFLAPMAAGEATAFDEESAIYWFAADYHGGQWSNLYSALSTSEYRPGPCENGPEGGIAQMLYDALVSEYTNEPSDTDSGMVENEGQDVETRNDRNATQS